MRHVFFLFGEAEKGEYCKPYLCSNLEQLCDTFGNPPAESLGIHYAVQALLFHRELIFFRVEEEGYSLQDYQAGIKLLGDSQKISSLSAICMPGMGNSEIIESTSSVCNLYKSCLILSEKDLYDYLTTYRLK